MNLFTTLDDLKPFIFRITDNGGESADRYTVITCDGDYYAMSSAPFHPQGVGMSGEGIDVQDVANNVEAGVERDLRWIDLPADCQRCVMDGLNQGFADYIESAPAATWRGDAMNFEGWRDYEYTSRRNREKEDGPTECVYEFGDFFMVRREDDDDYGPFDTFAEAFRSILPVDYDLSGPEYHTTVDMWNTDGGPVKPWDRDAEPPMIEEGNAYARVLLSDPKRKRIGWFATGEDAHNHCKRLEREFYEAAPIGGDDEFPMGAYKIVNFGGW